MYSIYFTSSKKLLQKISVTRNALFPFSPAPTHHSFTFNSRFLYELKHKFRLSKRMCGIFHFRFSFLFIKPSTKSVNSLNLKRIIPFKFKDEKNKTKNKNKQTKNRKTTHAFVPRPPIFKLQQDVLKSNDICVSRSSPKTGLESNFLSL